MWDSANIKHLISNTKQFVQWIFTHNVDRTKSGSRRPLQNENFYLMRLFLYLIRKINLVKFNRWYNFLQNFTRTKPGNSASPNNNGFKILKTVLTKRFVFTHYK